MFTQDKACYIKMSLGGIRNGLITHGHQDTSLCFIPLLEIHYKSFIRVTFIILLTNKVCLGWLVLSFQKLKACRWGVTTNKWGWRHWGESKSGAAVWKECIKNAGLQYIKSMQVRLFFPQRDKIYINLPPDAEMNHLFWPKLISVMFSCAIMCF